MICSSELLQWKIEVVSPSNLCSLNTSTPCTHGSLPVLAAYINAVNQSIEGQLGENSMQTARTDMSEGVSGVSELFRNTCNGEVGSGDKKKKTHHDQCSSEMGREKKKKRNDQGDRTKGTLRGTRAVGGGDRRPVLEVRKERETRRKFDRQDGTTTGRRSKDRSTSVHSLTLREQ
jgi:hypothetical protein